MSGLVYLWKIRSIYTSSVKPFYIRVCACNGRLHLLAPRRVSNLSRSPAPEDWAEVLFFPTARWIQVDEGAGGNRKVFASAAISVKDLYEEGIPRTLWPLEAAIDAAMRRMLKNAAKA